MSCQVHYEGENVQLPLPSLGGWLCLINPKSSSISNTATWRDCLAFTAAWPRNLVSRPNLMCTSATMLLPRPRDVSTPASSGVSAKSWVDLHYMVLNWKTWWCPTKHYNLSLDKHQQSQFVYDILSQGRGLGGLTGRLRKLQMVKEIWWGGPHQSVEWAEP